MCFEKTMKKIWKMLCDNPPFFHRNRNLYSLGLDTWGGNRLSYRYWLLYAVRCVGRSQNICAKNTKVFCWFCLHFVHFVWHLRHMEMYVLSMKLGRWMGVWFDSIIRELYRSAYIVSSMQAHIICFPFLLCRFRCFWGVTIYWLELWQIGMLWWRMSLCTNGSRDERGDITRQKNLLHILLDNLMLHWCTSLQRKFTLLHKVNKKQNDAIVLVIRLCRY